MLQRLQGAWINEKFSPELLEPQIEIVDCLMEQIVSMEDHLLSLEKGSFAIALHKMEIQRVKFLVSPVVAFFYSKVFIDHSRAPPKKFGKYCSLEIFWNVQDSNVKNLL